MKFDNVGVYAIKAAELREDPHPNPNYLLRPENQKRRDTLLEHFKRSAYAPWLPEYLLRAEISKDIAKRMEGTETKITFENGESYRRLDLKPSDSLNITITRDAAFLDAARICNKNPWVLLNVFVCSGASAPKVAMERDQFLVREMLRRAARPGDYTGTECPRLPIHFRAVKQIFHGNCKLPAAHDPSVRRDNAWP
ncbi:hypothetical protein EK21DRAFT_95681 [Setomelanomma holmii]|uniref:Uncharacterized protein n=1 Tax=Setomelanomma holmii TaxID=210430 RepID=A0A9P4GWG7_9PLEO|nr:hypothetical protein EK21DRAFT_95681 [Setomelanomma holmii]